MTMKELELTPETAAAFDQLREVQWDLNVYGMSQALAWRKVKPMVVKRLDSAGVMLDADLAAAPPSPPLRHLHQQNLQPLHAQSPCPSFLVSFGITRPLDRSPLFDFDAFSGYTIVVKGRGPAPSVGQSAFANRQSRVR